MIEEAIILMRQSTSQVEFEHQPTKKIGVDRSENSASREKKVRSTPSVDKIPDQNQKSQSLSHSIRRGQSQPKQIQYFGISKLIQSLNRSIQKDEYRFKSLQKEFKQSEKELYWIKKTKTKLEAIQKEKRERKEKRLEEQRREIRGLEVQIQRKLQGFEEQKEQIKQWIQKNEKRISLLKQEKEIYELGIDYKKSLRTNQGKELVQKRIKQLQQIIQNTSGLIKQRECSRTSYQKQYDECQIAINNLRKDQERQASQLDSAFVEKNIQKQLIQITNQDTTSECPFISRQNKRIQINLNASQPLKFKITKLQKEIDNYKKAIEVLEKIQNYQQIN